MSESVQRESKQLANEGTSVNEGWKVVYIYFCAFTGIFGVCKVQCYLSVQVTVLLEIKFLSNFHGTEFKMHGNIFLCPLNIQPVVIVRGLKRKQAAALTNFVGCFLVTLKEKQSPTERK